MERLKFSSYLKLNKKIILVLLIFSGIVALKLALKGRSVGKETGKTISLAEATTHWFVKLISHKG